MIRACAPSADGGGPLRSAVAVATLVGAGLGMCGCAASTHDSDLLTQVATLPQLAAGGYDGTVSCGALRRAGNFGLGTFDALDGEMVVLDGQVYRVSSDGVARAAADSVTTPFAAITQFDGDRSVPLQGGLSLAALGMNIDRFLPDTNVFYAVKVVGRFRRLRTRSVPRQHPPFAPLADVVRTQSTFDFTEVEGTLVGIRTPALASGFNQTGYHFHFLTADHRAGGHVLSLLTGTGTVTIDRTARWTILLKE